MPRMILAILILPLLAADCLPAAKTGCKNSEDCLSGRFCVAGTCRSEGPDAPLDTKPEKPPSPDFGSSATEKPILDAPPDFPPDFPPGPLDTSNLDAPPDLPSDPSDQSSPCTTTDDCPSPSVCNVATDSRCGLPTYVNIDVSADNTCAVASDGTLWCWGGNDRGQLGTSIPLQHRTPFQIPGQERVRMVATAWGHTCVLRLNGEVSCWGFNIVGTLGCGPTPGGGTAQQCTPYRAGSDARKIVAGAQRTCALLGNGTVECWGRNDHFEVGDGSDSTRDVPTPVRSITSATLLSSGLWQACVVLANGTVKCWGANDRAELGNGTIAATAVPTLVNGIDGTAKKAVDVSPAEDHSCVLLADHSVLCFGANTYGQLGDGTTALAQTPVPCNFPKTAVGIASGIYFTCALLDDNVIQCLGDGSHGQLGNGVFAKSPTPVQVSLPTAAGVTTLATKYNHACALTRDGRVFCWGVNAAGQLGDGSTDDSSRPLQVPPPRRN